MSKKEKKKSNEKLLMIVLAFTSFSIGIWANYRQLWLEEHGFGVVEISKIFSIALVCSSLIALLLCFFSGKIKVKNILLLAYTFRNISMCSMLFINDVYWIKAFMLLCIMCEVIYTIAFYPLLTFEVKTDESYRKKTTIEYFGKDIGVVSCGLLLGLSVGRFVFNYNTCLLIALISGVVSLAFLIGYESSEKVHKKASTLMEQFKDIFHLKVNRIFLYNQLIMNISYGIVFDLMMIILTNFIGFEVAFTSVFIIVCNMLGTVATTIFNRFSDKLSIGKSSVIKFGIRAVGYIVAFMLNTRITFIIAIVIAFITSRILEDKVTGAFLQIIDEDNQFLYGNIRYFIVSLGEGIGAFIAGVLLTRSFGFLFLGAAIITIIQTIIMLYLDKLKRKFN